MIIGPPPKFHGTRDNLHILEHEENDMMMRFVIEK